MVACDATLQTLAFEAESSWAEDVDTMTTAVQLCAPVSLSGITQEMLEPERVTARRLDSSKGTPGPFDNVTLQFECYLTGHGSATTGATTINALYTLLGRVLGGSAVAAPSGDTFSGGTSNIPTTTTAAGSNQIGYGALIRGGAFGDGRGGGQFYKVSSHVGNNLVLLNNMASAPNNGDVLYSASIAYAASSACAITGTRFRVQTADLQFVLHGGFPTGLTFSGLGPGQVPKVGFTWKFSWPEPTSTTFPTTPTASEFSPSPNTADGSCFFHTNGTPTRALISLRDFSVEYNLAVMPVEGGIGANAYQTITGATRGRDTCFVNIVVDGEGVDTTPTYWDEWLANTAKHMVWTGNSKATQAVGMSFPQLVYAGARPSQSNTGGRNTIPARFRAIASTDTASDLTLAPIVIAGA